MIFVLNMLCNIAKTNMITRDMINLMFEDRMLWYGFPLYMILILDIWNLNLNFKCEILILDFS